MFNDVISATRVLHLSVTSCLLRPNFLLSTMLPGTCSPCTFFSERPYETNTPCSRCIIPFYRSLCGMCAYICLLQVAVFCTLRFCPLIIQQSCLGS